MPEQMMSESDFTELFNISHKQTRRWFAHCKRFFVSATFCIAPTARLTVLECVSLELESLTVDRSFRSASKNGMRWPSKRGNRWHGIVEAR